MSKFSQSAKRIKERIFGKTGAIGTAANAAASAVKTSGKEAGMNSLMKTVQKGGFTKRQQYRLTKNILNKGFKEKATRAATVLGVANSMANAKAQVAKYNYQSYQDALDRYNKIINQNAQPAEGTGEPEGGDIDNTEVTPIGNH